MTELRCLRVVSCDWTQACICCSHLFVRVMDVYRRLGLVTPNALVEGLQKGSLQEGQGPSHLTTTLPQNLMTARLITEAQRTQLLHLRG